MWASIVRALKRWGTFGEKAGWRLGLPQGAVKRMWRERVVVTVFSHSGARARTDLRRPPVT
jgi:hypothetical protein